MYVSGNIICVETIPGMQGGMKENVEGVNSSVIYFKNFCKSHSVPLPSITIKNENRKKRIPLENLV
jgi:hypothetical protein